MVKLLKQMLYIEAKDKEFLLANITRVTQNNGISENSVFFCVDLLKCSFNEYFRFRVVAGRLRSTKTSFECVEKEF